MAPPSACPTLGKTVMASTGEDKENRSSTLGVAEEGRKQLGNS